MELPIKKAIKEETKKEVKFKVENNDHLKTKMMSEKGYCMVSLQFR